MISFSKKVVRSKWASIYIYLPLFKSIFYNNDFTFCHFYFQHIFI